MRQISWFGIGFIKQRPQRGGVNPDNSRGLGHLRKASVLRERAMANASVIGVRVFTADGGVIWGFSG